MTLIIIGLTGVFIHIGLMLDTATKKETFNFAKFFRNNIADWIISIAIVFLVFYAQDEVSQYFEINKLSMGFVGFFGVEIFRKFKKLFRNRFAAIK